MTSISEDPISEVSKDSNTNSMTKESNPETRLFVPNPKSNVEKPKMKMKPENPNSNSILETPKLNIEDMEVDILNHKSMPKVPKIPDPKEPNRKSMPKMIIWENISEEPKPQMENKTEKGHVDNIFKNVGIGSQNRPENVEIEGIYRICS